MLNSLVDSAETLNIPMARKVLEHLRAHPEEHDQDVFAVRGTACGTRACIAGTAVLMDPRTIVHWLRTEVGELVGEVFVDGHPVDLIDRAAEVLGLSDHDAVSLFFTYDDASALTMLAGAIEDAEQVQAGAL